MIAFLLGNPPLQGIKSQYPALFYVAVVHTLLLLLLLLL
jgi:hypothetical protein